MLQPYKVMLQPYKSTEEVYDRIELFLQHYKIRDYSF